MTQSYSKRNFRSQDWAKKTLHPWDYVIRLLMMPKCRIHWLLFAEHVYIMFSRGTKH